jgi:hypothetical protein
MKQGKGMQYLEMEETDIMSQNQIGAYMSGNLETTDRPPYHALIKESLMLTDNEVTISFIKMMIGVAILNFPAQSAYLGVFNGFLSTAIIVALIAKSNENLVKAIPLELMN